jgi:menaquinol-cytochrome c reductase iron-sulfur subunit
VEVEGNISTAKQGEVIMEENAPLTVPEGPDNTRRNFLKGLIGLLLLLVGLILGIPLLRSLGTKLQTRKQIWIKVAAVNSLPDNQPVNLKFTAEYQDAFRRQTVVHSVWVAKHSPTELAVYSPICTHLGCYYNWDPALNHFACPCHDSVFSVDGKVLAGPAPRSLDTMQYKVENGELFVVWQRFKAGIPEKVPV